MKNYVKPVINVVELSVKENLASLPAGITSAQTSTGTYAHGDKDIPLTVYDLTSLNTSQIQG